MLKIQTLSSIELGTYGEKLAKDIPSYPNDTPTYTHLPNSNAHSFFMYPTNEAEVSEIIMGLKNSRSSSTDGFTAKIIKHCRTQLVAPLTAMINKSMSSGTVPGNLKV